MREIIFSVLRNPAGDLQARAEALQLSITAASQEELHHEARDALIAHLGPAHCTYRLRFLWPARRLNRAADADRAVPGRAVLGAVPA